MKHTNHTPPLSETERFFKAVNSGLTLALAVWGGALLIFLLLALAFMVFFDINPG